MCRVLKVFSFFSCFEKVPVVGRKPFSKVGRSGSTGKNRPLISTSTEYEVFKMMTLEVYAMIMDILVAHINC